MRILVLSLDIQIDFYEFCHLCFDYRSVHIVFKYSKSDFVECNYFREEKKKILIQEKKFRVK